MGNFTSSFIHFNGPFLQLNRITPLESIQQWHLYNIIAIIGRKVEDPNFVIFQFKKDFCVRSKTTQWKMDENDKKKKSLVGNSFKIRSLLD